MNLARVAKLRSLLERSEVSDWPTCLHCTEASQTRDGGARWVPVEGYRVEPDVFASVPLVGGARVVDVEHASRLRRGESLRSIAAPRLMQSVDAIGRLRPARILHSKGWFTVIAECHGCEGIAEIDVPLRHGFANVKRSIRELYFFGNDNRPTTLET